MPKMLLRTLQRFKNVKLFKKLRNNSVSSRLFLSFFALAVLIISLEVFAMVYIRQMQMISSLRESFFQLKETQLHMKSASNEFILRERSQELFFSTGKSQFLEKYVHYLTKLQKNIKEIQTKGAALGVIDHKEFTTLQATVKEHRLVFLQMVAWLKARGYGRYGLIGDFDKSIESLLNYNFGKDKQAVLNLQLFVKNYLLTGDENLANNISNEVYRFTMILEEHVKDEDVEKVSQILINYEKIFKQLTKVDEELGIYTGGGLQKRLFTAIDDLDRAIGLEIISGKINAIYDSCMIKIYSSFLLIVGAAVMAAIGMNWLLYKTLVIPIQEMKSVIMGMSKGEVYTGTLRFRVSDLNEMAKALNNLMAGLKNYQGFANNIGNGNLDVSFTPLSNQDILGNSLLSMRNSLKANISRQHIQMLELQRLNKELDNFTYHASHDLRAPLTTILGLVNLGLNDSHQSAHSYFNMIKNRVDHMDKLLKDLISISYNNKIELSHEEFDFDAELKTLLNSLNSGHPVKFDILIDIQQNSPFISDPVRIRTILSNLLSNSFKYYNPDVSHPYIDLTIRVDFTKASILIKDNGIGIENTHQDKIFNMFFRATTRSTGTGLGLFIVKSMIDRLNGEIKMESVPNEGTNFHVTLPNLLDTYEASAHFAKPDLVTGFAQAGSSNTSIL